MTLSSCLRRSATLLPLAVLLAPVLVVPASLSSQTPARSLGVQIAPDSPQDTLGAQVTAVLPGTLAERLGLRAGDRILRIGRVDLVRHRSDPRGAASSAGRIRAALAEPGVAEGGGLVPVLVWRDGSLLTGIGGWSGSVPVPLQDAEAVFGAFATLASQGVVPVESPGSVGVPATGGAGSVPSFGDVPVPSSGGAVAVPSTGGSAGVPSTGGAGGVPSAGKPVGGSGGSGSSSGSPSREWRAACASLTGPRPAGKYYWLSGSGSSSEMLWLNADGSYSTQRSSAYSSYAEDGCFTIQGNRITFYKVASSAMGSAPGATGQRGVTLGSASGATFEPRTVSFASTSDVLVIGGDRYTRTTDR